MPSLTHKICYFWALIISLRQFFSSFILLPFSLKKWLFQFTSKAFIVDQRAFLWLRTRSHRRNEDSISSPNPDSQDHWKDLDLLLVMWFDLLILKMEKEKIDILCCLICSEFHWITFFFQFQRPLIMLFLYC